MREPSIKLTLRGPQDRHSRRRLYLRYSYNYQTNYISLPWKFDPADWDEAKQTVKAKALLNGEGAANVNRALRQKLADAYNITANLLAEEISPDFEHFSQRFRGDKSVKRAFHEIGEEVIGADLAAKKISAGTHSAYRAALRQWGKIEGSVSVASVSKSHVVHFHEQLCTSYNHNLAAQYVRNCRVVYNRVLAKLQMPDRVQPFAAVEIKPQRISEKKTMTIDEYNKFYAALEETAPGSKDFETLRRFLLMCRGLRFSDTGAIHRDKHYFELEEKGVTLRYISKPAQKTDVAGLVPISDRDAEWLLRWQPDGLLFEPVIYETYVSRLKQISQEIIGRELTTHYGRHFAGDFIVNSGMSLDDAKAILGIRNDEIARIYAKQDIKNLLQKFYSSVAKVTPEKD